MGYALSSETGECRALAGFGQGVCIPGGKGPTDVSWAIFVPGRPTNHNAHLSLRLRNVKMSFSVLRLIIGIAQYASGS